MRIENFEQIPTTGNKTPEEMKKDGEMSPAEFVDELESILSEAEAKAEEHKGSNPFFYEQQKQALNIKVTQSMNFATQHLHVPGGQTEKFAMLLEIFRLSNIVMQIQWKEYCEKLRKIIEKNKELLARGSSARNDTEETVAV